MNQDQQDGALDLADGMCCSVSLSDLVGLLGELRSRDIDLYLDRQALDTGTSSGRMLFGMLGVFSNAKRIEQTGGDRNACAAG